MKTISENTFKDKLLAIFYELETNGEEVRVMVDGQIALKLISYHRELVNDATNDRQHRVTTGLLGGMPTFRRNLGDRALTH